MKMNNVYKFRKIKNIGITCFTPSKNIFNFFIKIIYSCNLKLKYSLCKYDFLEIWKNKKLNFQKIQFYFKQEIKY